MRRDTRNWDAASLQGLAMSPDGRLLATSSRDCEIGLCEPRFADPVHRRIVMEPLEAMACHNEAGPDRLGRIYRVSSDAIRVFENDLIDHHISLLAGNRIRDVLWRDDTLFAANQSGELSRWTTVDEPKLIETVPMARHSITSCEFLGSNRLLVNVAQLSIGVLNLAQQRFEQIWPEHHRPDVMHGECRADG